MAMFRIEDFSIYNSFTDITAVSWEVSLNSDFSTLIDSTYKDETAVNGWYSKLPKPNNNGYYDNHTVMYIRCKIYVDNHAQSYGESKWFTNVINDTFTRKVRIRKGKKVISEIEYDEKMNITKLW